MRFDCCKVFLMEANGLINECKLSVEIQSTNFNFWKLRKFIFFLSFLLCFQDIIGFIALSFTQMSVFQNLLNFRCHLIVHIQGTKNNICLYSHAKCQGCDIFSVKLFTSTFFVIFLFIQYFRSYTTRHLHLLVLSALILIVLGQNNGNYLSLTLFQTIVKIQSMHLVAMIRKFFKHSMLLSEKYMILLMYQYNLE